jgi:hypothetical protein
LSNTVLSKIRNHQESGLALRQPGGLAGGGRAAEEKI